VNPLRKAYQRVERVIRRNALGKRAMKNSEKGKSARHIMKAWGRDGDPPKVTW
jgi:hypothetical protein